MAEYDLISKTALLEHLDMAMECENCPRNANKELYKCVHNLTPERCTCSDIAQICIRITEFATFADVQPVNQWISIDERLPQDGEEALVYAGNRGVMIGLYDSILQVWLDYEGCGFKVTHWQPLPEPPKKEG